MLLNSGVMAAAFVDNIQTWWYTLFFSLLLDPTIIKLVFMPYTSGKIIAGIQGNKGGIHWLHFGDNPDIHLDIFKYFCTFRPEGTIMILYPKPSRHSQDY